MRGLLLGALLLPLLVATAAEAGVQLGVGADWAFTHSGLFELTLSADKTLARGLRVGGRFGAALGTQGPTLAVPLDLRLRLLVARSRLYLEGLVGPWIFFEGAPLRLHGAFGFGLRRRSFEFGLELGYLAPSPILGLRLAWRI